MSRRVFMPCGVTEPHPSHTAGPGFGTFRCPGVEATTNAGPVPIRLPPEPPRDRVIEAVTPHGEVRRSWERYPTGNPWRDQQTGDLVHFEDIVYEVQSLSRFGPVDLSLRHVPAEGGEKT